MNIESPKTFPIIITFVEVEDKRIHFKLTQLETLWII